MSIEYVLLQASGSLDLDVTSPKQLNRRLFLKQLAVDLCNSERRILFRAQYVRYAYIFKFLHPLIYINAAFLKLKLG